MTHIYNTIGNPPPSLLGTPIEESIPKITDDDIDKGTIDRYFARQANHSVGEILEIDKPTFQKLHSNTFWKTVQITWRIAGKLDDVMGPPRVNTPVRLYTGVITANQIATIEAEKELPGMKLKLPNPTQYWVGR